MSINEYLEDRGIAKDPVNHPSHYETGKFECIDVMEEALGRDAVESFCICNAFKYLYRSKRKNGIEDLKKARWYLNKLIEMMDEDEDQDDGKGVFEHPLENPYRSIMGVGPKVDIHTMHKRVVKDYDSVPKSGPFIEEDEDQDDGKGEFEDDNLVEFLKMAKGEN